MGSVLVNSKSNEGRSWTLILGQWLQSNKDEKWGLSSTESHSSSRKMVYDSQCLFSNSFPSYFYSHWEHHAYVYSILFFYILFLYALFFNTEMSKYTKYELINFYSVLLYSILTGECKTVSYGHSLYIQSTTECQNCPNTRTHRHAHTNTHA